MSTLMPKLPKSPSGRALKVLIGKWRSEVKFPDPNIPVMTGLTICKWLEKDLLMSMDGRINFKGPKVQAPPRSKAVIGADDITKDFMVVYCDERGVSRHYEMTITPKKWVMTRKEKGFYQRFTGLFSANRRVIKGEWQASKDGRKWEHDFFITYTKK